MRGIAGKPYSAKEIEILKEHGIAMTEDGTFCCQAESPDVATTSHACYGDKKCFGLHSLAAMTNVTPPCKDATSLSPS